MDGVVWAGIVLVWLGFEFWALRSRSDDIEPFTYWVRKTLNLKRGPFALGWWLALGLIAWVAWHFLIEGVFIH